MAPSPPLPPTELDTISRKHAVSKRAPKLALSKRSMFWRNRTPSRNPKKRVLTAGDRSLQAKKREQHRHEYQDALEGAQATVRELAEGLRNRFGKYSVDHYLNDLIHREHKSRSERKVNPWNAYQKLELERMKREASDNASNLNLTEINKQISDQWKTLSPDQREAITAESIQTIEEQRERKKLVAHSVPLSSFHDARSTIQSVETQLARLHARTGLEFLLVACRSTVEDFARPFAYFSSDTVKGFFSSSLNRSVDDFALQLEAYVMSGVKGVVENSRTQTLELKKKTTGLIVEKLRAITGTTQLHMEYKRFDDLITRKYGVVIKNWPLEVFCNPSAVRTRVELELLFNGWESGTTRFQKLSKDEMNVWESKQFSSQVATMSVSPPPTPFLLAALPDTRVSPTSATSSPPPEDMVVLSELAGQEAPQPTSNPGQGATPTSALDMRSPTPNSQLVAKAIRLDPTLQSIDPTLIMVGVAQGHHGPTTASSVTEINHPPALAPLTSQKKRKERVFEIITPQSFDTRSTKKPRKGRKATQANGNVPTTGGGGTVPVEGIIH